MDNLNQDIEMFQKKCIRKVSLMPICFLLFIGSAITCSILLKNFSSNDKNIQMSLDEDLKKKIILPPLSGDYILVEPEGSVPIKVKGTPEKCRRSENCI